MTIKNPFAFAAAIVAAVLLAYLIGERLVFLAGAERTVGEVKDVSARRGRCGRYGFACTEFTATVVFAAGGAEHVIFVHAGSASGYGRSVTFATYQVGAPVTIVFSTRNPTRAYQDTASNVWGAAIMLLMVLLTAVVWSFREPYEAYHEEQKSTTLFGGSGFRG